MVTVTRHSRNSHFCVCVFVCVCVLANYNKLLVMFLIKSLRVMYKSFNADYLSVVQSNAFLVSYYACFSLAFETNGTDFCSSTRQELNSMENSTKKYQSKLHTDFFFFFSCI